ncbi:MAG: VWA domain-containing protein [bacterium]|nr:VWA domain-containing protein [bacterium]
MQHRIAPVLTLLILWTLLPAAAQLPERKAATGEGAQEGPPEGVFIDTVDVNIVNVEVYVTDKSGNRVAGLTRDDFELRLDRKPVAVTNFYAVEGGKARSGEGIELVEEPASEPAVGRPEPEAPSVPEEQRLHLVVYIDNFNLHPFSRNRAIRFVRTFLRTRLRREDRVMLVSYERSLHIRHPFTSDSEIIASALYELEELSGHAVHRDSDRRDIMETIYDALDDDYQQTPTGINSVRSRVESYAEALYNDMSFSIDAVREIVESLAGLPGRKAILYVSDGLPMRPGEDAFYAVHNEFQDSSVLMDIQNYDLSRRFQSLTSLANANRVTFYTIDAEGLRTYSYLDVANRAAGGGAFIDQTHFANIQAPLQMLAAETGGMAILNTNDFTKPLNRVADDFASYYSLGFSSAGTVGRYHRIEVIVKGRKGLTVRHREGYRDKPVTSRMADTTMAALHYGYQNNPLGIDLELGRQSLQEEGHFLVEVVIKIPLGGLAFIEQQDKVHGRIRLFMAAMDSEGGMAPVQDMAVPIAIPRADFERARETDFRYQVSLQMRRGRQRVAIGVRDEIGAVSAFVTRGLSVGR